MTECLWGYSTVRQRCPQSRRVDKKNSPEVENTGQFSYPRGVLQVCVSTPCREPSVFAIVTIIACRFWFAADLRRSPCVIPARSISAAEPSTSCCSGYGCRCFFSRLAHDAACSFSPCLILSLSLSLSLSLLFYMCRRQARRPSGHSRSKAFSSFQ